MSIFFDIDVFAIGFNNFLIVLCLWFQHTLYINEFMICLQQKLNKISRLYINV